MYAKKKTNINRNKSFDPLSGKNQTRFEEAEAAETQRSADVQKRTQTLLREQMEDRYDQLHASSIVGGASSSSSAPSAAAASKPLATATGFRPRRIELIGEVAKKGDDDGTTVGSGGTLIPLIADPTQMPKRSNTAEAYLSASSAPSPPSTVGSSGAALSGSGAAATTGRVTREEVAQLRREVEDTRKRLRDPMSVMESATRSAEQPPSQKGFAATSTTAVGKPLGASTSSLRRFL